MIWFRLILKEVGKDNVVLEFIEEESWELRKEEELS